MPIAVAEAILEESLFQPEQLPDALDLAGQMLGLDYFGLVSADFSRPRYIMSARQSEALDAYFKGGWIEDDYRIRGESAMPTGELFLDHINVDDQVRRSSAVYNEFFLPNDMVNYAGIRFEVDGAHWFCAAARGETRGVIDDQTAWKFVRMANTAIRSVSVASRLEATRAQGLLEGLEISRTAAILLDEEGRVSAVTSAAEALFDDAFGVRERQLWADVDKDAEALSHLTQYARTRLPELPRRNFLIRGHGRTRPIQISATRVLRSGLDILPRARLLLLLTQVGVQPRSRNEELCRRFGLTAAEADVACQFVNGRSIPEIAAERRVTESTIREQMKAIHRKTGVTRQVDLIRLLSPFRS